VAKVSQAVSAPDIYAYVPNTWLLYMILFPILDQIYRSIDADRQIRLYLPSIYLTIYLPSISLSIYLSDIGSKRIDTDRVCTAGLCTSSGNSSAAGQPREQFMSYISIKRGDANCHASCFQPSVHSNMIHINKATSVTHWFNLRGREGDQNTCMFHR